MVEESATMLLDFKSELKYVSLTSSKNMYGIKTYTTTLEKFKLGWLPTNVNMYLK